MLHEFEHETTLTTTVVNYVYDVTSSVARRTMMKKALSLETGVRQKGGVRPHKQDLYTAAKS